MPACALVVEFDLRPGTKPNFLKVMREHARLTLAEEPGCQRFDVLEPEGEDDRILLYELYVDRAAYETHRQGARMPGVGKAIDPLLAGRKVTVSAIE